MQCGPLSDRIWETMHAIRLYGFIFIQKGVPMHKKYLSLITAVSLTAVLAACGSEPAGTTPASTAAVQTEETTQASAPVVFEELVLVDDENCTFKITALEEDPIWGYTMKAYLENKTDKELIFSINNASVNGFMCDPFWAATVSAGMKANEEITFPSQGLERNGIETVTEIEIPFRVYDSNDWEADDVVDEVFTIYPLGQEAVQSFTRQAVEGETVLYDDENCTVIVTGFDPENIWGYTVNVYLENKTDKDLMFSIGGAAVNGFMCDPFWAETVAAGKRSNTAISWMTQDFEENGITEVESLTLPFRVYDADDWAAEDLVNETFTVNP